MADQSQPIYSWRPTGTQQGSNYFGAKPSFGQALNGGVQAAGGAQSPFQQSPPAQGGGFNIPGGNSAGFDSPTFAGAASNDGAKTPPPASFGDALRSNPLSTPFPTSPADAASQAALRSAVGNLQPNQGPSMSSMFALNEENKAEAEALRKSQESAALNGRAFTGQIAGDTANTLSQQIIPQRQNFLGQLQGQEQQQAITKQQNAQQNILALTGQAQSASQFQQSQAQQATQFGQTLALNTQLGLGDLSVREKSLAQSASQFTDQLSFQKYATDKGFTNDEAQRAWQATQNAAQIASTQTIAFAGLDQQKAQLAQQAMQFNSNQDFQKWATQAGLDAETQKQVWQATQNEKDRQLQAGQGDLNRTLQKYIADQGYSMDSQKLQTQIQQFTSQQDFQKWATQAGLDADTQKLMWQANQNDIQRKQDLGMQLTANEQQVRMQGLQDASAQAMAKLNQTLNLDTIDKQTQSQALLKTMDQNFQSMMTDKNFSNEQALDATKQQYATELQKQGFDQQTAMQAADQWFQGQQADKQLAQTKQLAEAQMAQTYQFQMNDLQQKYNFKQDDIDQANAALNQQAQQFAVTAGMDQQKFDLLKQSTQFQNLSSTTSTLMAMAGDNKDMLQFAAENFYKGLANMPDPSGAKDPTTGQPAMMMSKDQAAQGILNIKAASFTDPTSFGNWAAGQKDGSGNALYTPDQIKAATANTGVAGSSVNQQQQFSDYINKTSTLSADDKTALQKYSNDVVNAYQGAIPGQTIMLDTGHGAYFDAAARALRAKGIDTDKYVQAGPWEEAGKTSYKGTPEFVNYSLYTQYLNSGMKPIEAQTALVKLIGEQKAVAALNLDGTQLDKSLVESGFGNSFSSGAGQGNSIVNGQSNGQGYV